MRDPLNEPLPQVLNGSHPERPMPWPRPRFRVVRLGAKNTVVSFQTPESAQRKTEFVQMFMLCARSCGWKVSKAPISAVLVFVFPGRARMNHTKRPDIDNLAKLVLDAGNGVLWEDDSQVCHLDVRKVYGSPLDRRSVGTFFHFREMTEELTWTFEEHSLPSTSVRRTSAGRPSGSQSRGSSSKT